MFRITQIHPGIYEIGHKIATQNLVPGTRVYAEELLTYEGKEYRFWEPSRSKTGAAVKKGINELKIGPGSKVLYLGAAEGTTISHLSDIVGLTGLVFGVDISARSMRKFVYLCEQRKNLVPILADASQPMTYKEYITNFSIDALFQDVSQKNQAEIFLRNARAYLKGGGYGYLAIKVRSISASDSYEAVVEDEIKKLENEFEILQVIDLGPYEKEHAMVVCKRK